MKLTEFKIDIPEKLIAKHPLPNRDDSRMMVLHRDTQKIEHKQFRDVLDYHETGDAFVVNNTMVFPARLIGNKERTGAQIEVFLLRELNGPMKLWDVLVDPARKIRVGNKLYFGPEDSLVAEVVDNTTSRGRTIRFMFDGTTEELVKILDGFGETPIPKSFEREATPEDAERYQTLFAKKRGAVVAPSAGLHFSQEIIKRAELKGVPFAEITLHTGLAAFRAVEVEDLTKHKSDSEPYEIDEEAVRVVNTALDGKHKITAVGTTVLRALESSVSATGQLKTANGWTDRFIFPPYRFNVPTRLLTNFHLSESPLLMTTTAFAGYDFLMHAYDVAKKEGYRWFAYGDAMLIL